MQKELPYGKSRIKTSRIRGWVKRFARRRLGSILIGGLLIAGCSDNGGKTSLCSQCDDGDCTLVEAADCSGIGVGVAVQPTEEPLRLQRITENFNLLSAEGEFLWRLVHPEPDRWDFALTDEVVDFAENHGMRLTATHFVWDQVIDFDGTPPWVQAITDPDELRAVMHDHMATLAERYGSRIDRWIVVNEPLEYFETELVSNHFHQVLGPDYIAKVFAIAAEAAPESELWINEIFLEDNPEKSEAYIQLVTDLVERGVPLHGAGVQGHLFFGTPDFDLLENVLRRLGELGIATAITELDAPTEPGEAGLALNAERMAKAFTACTRVFACESVTVWGLDDEQSWLNWLLGPGLAPLLFDAELQPKPSYYAVRDVLIAGR